MSLDDIRARTEAATDGPWTFMGGVEKTAFIESPLEEVLIHDNRGRAHLSEDYTWIKPADGEFIAHARQDIPRLLAALDAVQRIISEAEEAHRVAQEGSPTRLLAYPMIDATDLQDAITEALN